MENINRLLPIDISIKVPCRNDEKNIQETVWRIITYPDEKEPFLCFMVAHCNAFINQYYWLKA